MAKTVTHLFNVWVTVPAVSGDGWSKYPEYDHQAVARSLRRVLHNSQWDGPFWESAEVEHAETTDEPD
jgi:hypothetical protein